MIRSRIAAVAALTAALLSGALLSAAPASAYTAVDTAITTSSNNNANFVQTAVQLQQGVANGDGTRAVAFSCEGLSSGASTSLYGCNLYVNGNFDTRGTTMTLPGPAVAGGGTNIRVPQGATVYACGGTSAIFVDGEILAARVCTPPTIISASI
jgi:hypothetical protein